MASIDVDAWAEVLTRAAGADLLPGAVASVSRGRLLPTSLALRAREILVGGRHPYLVVGGGREGLLVARQPGCV